MGICLAISSDTAAVIRTCASNEQLSVYFATTPNKKSISLPTHQTTRMRSASRHSDHDGAQQLVVVPTSLYILVYAGYTWVSVKHVASLKLTHRRAESACRIKLYSVPDVNFSQPTWCVTLKKKRRDFSYILYHALWAPSIERCCYIRCWSESAYCCGEVSSECVRSSVREIIWWIIKNEINAIWRQAKLTFSRTLSSFLLLISLGQLIHAEVMENDLCQLIFLLFCSFCSVILFALFLFLFCFMCSNKMHVQAWTLLAAH